MTESRRHDAIAWTILAAVPTLLFLDVLLGLNGFYIRDVVHYYFPAKKILRDIVLGGDFPYWNPWFGAGQPLAANPEHEVFYPLNWLILLPGYHYVFQLLPLIHIYITVFATYALLRSMSLGRPASVFGALGFGVGGLVVSSMNLFPILFSVCWMPLTFLYARRYLLHRARRDFALAAFFLGLQLLVGEPTTAFQTGLLLGMYAIWRAFADRDEGAKLAKTFRPAAINVAIIGAISIGALLVAAVQIVPAWDHFGDSVRSRGIHFSVVSRWSMPFERIAELFYPTALGHDSAHGYAQYWAAALYGESRMPFYFSIYSGLLLTVAAFAGLIARKRGAALFGVITVLSIILAAGSNTPLLRWLYDAGLFRSARYAEKFILMAVFAMVVFGAKMLDRLLAGDERLRKTAVGVGIAITAVAAIVVVVSFTSAYEPLFRLFWRVPEHRVLTDALPVARSEWILAALRGLLLVLLLRNVARVKQATWLALAGAFALFDFGALIPELAPRMPMEYYTEPPSAVRQFPEERDDFRIFHMANWAAQSKAALEYLRPSPELYWISRNSLTPALPPAYRLRLVAEADFDLTSLVETDDFTSAVWDLSKRRQGDWLNYVTAMSNAWYIGVYRKPEEALARANGVRRDMEPVKFIKGQEHPRYYFADEMERATDWRDFVRKMGRKTYSRRVAFIDGPAFAPAPGTVRAKREWVNGARLDVEAAGQAFLVLSVTPHKYWQVTLDGSEIRPFVTNVGFQGIVVPPGRHVVEMRYRNPLIAVGGAITLAALIALAWAARTMRGL